MEVPQKMKVSDLRKEIGEHKKSLFKNVAVMRSDDLRKYLDELRMTSNLIDAKQAQNKMGPTMPEHQQHHEEPKHEKTEIDTDSDDSEKEEKKVVKKIEKKVEKVQKEMKKEKNLNPIEHKKEKKTLEEIPKELKSMVKKHMKDHPDHSEKKALSQVKKNLFKVLS